MYVALHQAVPSAAGRDTAIQGTHISVSPFGGVSRDCMRSSCMFLVPVAAQVPVIIRSVPENKQKKVSSVSILNPPP